jgi:hypothetical protein
MLSGMFSVSEAEAAAIRAAYEQGSELAAVELRRYFRGIDSNAKAREAAHIIAGWNRCRSCRRHSGIGVRRLRHKKGPGRTGAKGLQTPATMTVNSADRAEALHCADDRRNRSNDRAAIRRRASLPSSRAALR